jgi:alkylhydroperoxidase family enzyme
MRLDQPRVLPTTPNEWDADSRPLMEAVERNNGRVMTVFRTIARHPKLLKRWSVFGNHILAGNTLPARDRELVILRTGFLCGSGYEWAQHVAMGRAAGLTDIEIERIADDPAAAAWTADDHTLVDATDQLVRDTFIDDATWAALCNRFDERQRMDLVFTIGEYVLVSMALNTFGVQIEDDVERFPARLFRNGRFPT